MPPALGGEMGRRLFGHYVETQAEGAIANGARVRKRVAEEGDSQPVGAMATVLGSVGPFAEPGTRYGYFVQWDEIPNVAVFVVDWKIEAA